MNPTPYSNVGHNEMADYRSGRLRVSFTPNNYCTPEGRPWSCIRDGTVTTLCGATAIEAMRLLGEPDPGKWKYSP